MNQSHRPLPILYKINCTQLLIVHTKSTSGSSKFKLITRLRGKKILSRSVVAKILRSGLVNVNNKIKFNSVLNTEINEVLSLGAKMWTTRNIFSDSSVIFKRNSKHFLIFLLIKQKNISDRRIKYGVQYFSKTLRTKCFNNLHKS